MSHKSITKMPNSNIDINLLKRPIVHGAVEHDDDMGKEPFSLKRRKTLNNWAFSNKKYKDIPIRMNKKWLKNYGYADKNAFY